MDSLARDNCQSENGQNWLEFLEQQKEKQLRLGCFYSSSTSADEGQNSLLLVRRYETFQALEVGSFNDLHLGFSSRDGVIFEKDVSLGLHCWYLEDLLVVSALCVLEV